MKKLIAKYKLELVGVVIGAVAGWAYWFFVGCASGTCPITSSAVNSTLYGMLLGALTFSLLKKENNKQTNKQ